MKNTKHPDIKDDLPTLLPIRDHMLAAKREIDSTLDAVNAYAALCNGRGDVIGALNAYEAREAVLGLQQARQSAHNRLASLLVENYGAEQAGKLIISTEKGPGR
jgi:hypothetical protein